MFNQTSTAISNHLTVVFQLLLRSPWSETIHGAVRYTRIDRQRLCPKMFLFFFGHNCHVSWLHDMEKMIWGALNPMTWTVGTSAEANVFFRWRQGCTQCFFFLEPIPEREDVLAVSTYNILYIYTRFRLPFSILITSKSNFQKIFHSKNQGQTQNFWRFSRKFHEFLACCRGVLTLFWNETVCVCARSWCCGSRWGRWQPIAWRPRWVCWMDHEISLCTTKRMERMVESPEILIILGWSTVFNCRISSTECLHCV